MLKLNVYLDRRSLLGILHDVLQTLRAAMMMQLHSPLTGSCTAPAASAARRLDALAAPQTTRELASGSCEERQVEQQQHAHRPVEEGKDLQVTCNMSPEIRFPSSVQRVVLTQHFQLEKFQLNIMQLEFLMQCENFYNTIEYI